MIKKIILDITTSTLTYPVIESFIWYKDGVKATGTTSVVSTQEFNFDINGEVLNYTTPQLPYSGYKFENIMKEGTLFYWAANNPKCNITITLPDNFDWDRYEIRPTNNNNSTRYYCKEILAHYIDENGEEIYSDYKSRPNLTNVQFENTFKMTFNNPSKFYTKSPYNNITLSLSTKTTYAAGMARLEFYHNNIKIEGSVVKSNAQSCKYVLANGKEIYVSTNGAYSGYNINAIFNTSGYGFIGNDSLRPVLIYINWFDDSLLIDGLKFQISPNTTNELRTLSEYIIDFNDREASSLYKRISWKNDELFDRTHIQEEVININEYYIEDDNKRYIYYFNKLEEVTGTEKTFTDINNLNKNLVSNLVKPTLKCKFPFNIQVKQNYNKWFKFKEPFKVKDLKNLSSITASNDFADTLYSMFFAFFYNGDFLTFKMNPMKFNEDDQSFTEEQFLIDNVANPTNQKNIINYLKTFLNNLEDNDELELGFSIFNRDKNLYKCNTRSFSLNLSAYDVYKPDTTLSSRVRKDSINVYSKTASTYRLNWYEEQSSELLNNPQPVRTIKIYTYNTLNTINACMYGIGFDDYIIEISDMVEEGTTFTGTITLTKGDEIISGKATLLNNNSYGDLSTIFKNIYTGAVADNPRGAGITLILELTSDITFRYFKITNFYSTACYNSNVIVNCYDSSNVLKTQKLICEDILGYAVNYQELYDVWN